MNMDIELFNELITMALVGAASGLVGAFALMKKMALASDAISHIALPGLGLAILFKINPLLGGAAALLAGTALIWLVEKRSSIATDVVIGVVFSASLALGGLLTPQEELLEALFGATTKLSLSEIILGSAAALGIIGFIAGLKHRLTLSAISRDLAKTTGVNVDITNLLFLIAFSLNVILGLKFLGVLLMGSLIIIPAAISKNLAWNLTSDLCLSAILAVICVVIGFYLAQILSLAVGPAIISVAALLFFGSLILKRN